MVGAQASETADQIWEQVLTATANPTQRTPEFGTKSVPYRLSTNSNNINNNNNSNSNSKQTLLEKYLDLPALEALLVGTAPSALPNAVSSSGIQIQEIHLQTVIHDRLQGRPCPAADPR